MVRMDEVLDEAEAALENRSSVAERALDGLPQGDPGVNKGHNADAKEVLAGGLTAGAPDNQAKVENEPDDVAGMMEIEIDVDALMTVPQGLDDKAHGELDGDVGYEDQKEVNQEGGGALGKRGQRHAGKRFSACGSMRFEITAFAFFFHSNTIRGERRRQPGRVEFGSNLGWRFPQELDRLRKRWRFRLELAKNIPPWL